MVFASTMKIKISTFGVTVKVTKGCIDFNIQRKFVEPEANRLTEFSPLSLGRSW